MHDSILNPIGSEWQKDECTSCRCSELAVIECFHEQCNREETNCAEEDDRSLNIKGQCCSVCLGKLFFIILDKNSGFLSHKSVCIYKENVYALNEQFRDGPCRNCSCKTDSQIECLEIQCSIECRDATYVPEQCCPICKSKLSLNYIYLSIIQIVKRFCLKKGLQKRYLWRLQQTKPQKKTHF